MLRVRPIATTPRLHEMRRLLTTLGLVATDEGKEGGREWVILDAGKGRVELREASSGDRLVTFGVEVRDQGEFARRTVEAGGNATLEDGERGRVALIKGPDGFSFRAEPTTHGATCADADSRLTVRITWQTPDVTGAVATLQAIGARPRGSTPEAQPRGSTPEARPRGSTPEAQPPQFDRSPVEPTEFIAKNGGVFAAVRAETVGHGGLEFEYDGDLAALAARLTEAGTDVGTTAHGLEIVTPDGDTIAVVPAPHAIGEPHAVEQ